MKKFIFAGFLVLMLLPLVSISGAESILFGPEAFERSEGSPNVFTENFNAPPGNAFLVVFNGDDDQDSRVSSGNISINGNTVVQDSELNEQEDRIIKPVNLQGSNSMSITLDGDGGGYIIVMVLNDRRLLPEFTAGRLQLAWTSIADPNEAVSLRLKNGSPRFARSYVVRFYNEDGSLSSVSARQELPPHGSVNATVQSYLPQGSAWQTGSIEILFSGLGGGRVLGFEMQSDAQGQTAVPLEGGGIRHFFNAPKKR